MLECIESKPGCSAPRSQTLKTERNHRAWKPDAAASPQVLERNAYSMPPVRPPLRCLDVLWPPSPPSKRDTRHGSKPNSLLALRNGASWARGAWVARRLSAPLHRERRAGCHGRRALLAALCPPCWRGQQWCGEALWRARRAFVAAGARSSLTARRARGGAGAQVEFTRLEIGRLRTRTTIRRWV